MINVTCQNCSAVYRLDETKIPASGGFITCKTCKTKNRVTPDGIIPLQGTAAEPTAPAPPAAAPAADSAIPLGGQAKPPPPPPDASAIPLDSASPAPPAQPPPAPSDAAAGTIPLAGNAAAASPPPPPQDDAPLDFAVPLPSGEAQPAPETSAAPAAPAPAAATPPPAPKDSIPLAGNAPTPSLMDDAIPLADGGAPSLMDDSIPLDGSTSQTPAPAPASGGEAGAVPLPAADGAPMLMDDDDIIPLAGGDDVSPIEDEPSDSQLSLPDATAMTDGGDAGVGDLFDLPPATTEGTSSAAAPPPPPEEATSTPAASAPTPEFLNDVPPAQEAAVGEDLFADLPTAVTDGAGAGAIEAGAGGLELDEPNDSGGLVPNLMEDLPAPDTPTVDLTTDIGGIPAAQGDVPDLDSGSIPDLDLGDSSEAMPDPFAGMVPEASPIGTPADDEVNLDGVPTTPVADMGDGMPNEAASAPQERGKGKGGRLVMIVAGLAVVLVGTGIFAGPQLGIDAFDPLRDMLGLSSSAGPTKPPPNSKKKTKPKEKKKALAKAKTRAKAPDPEPLPEVSVTANNVDTVAYPQLREAVGAIGDDDAELRMWAWFRLAHSFGDAAAAKKLTEATPKKPDGLGAMGAAATVGSMVLAGKVPPARRLGEKLAKKHRESPQMAYALGAAYLAKPASPKAAGLFERAIILQPEMRDAQLARALALTARGDSAGARTMVSLVKKWQDPNAAARAVPALIEQDMLSLVAETMESLSPKLLDRVAPPQRDAFLSFMVRQAIRDGDIGGALELAKQRAEGGTSEAKLELARLQQAQGADGVGTLLGAFDTEEDPEMKARLVSEIVAMHLSTGDTEAATKALQKGADLPPRAAGGWLNYAEALIAIENDESNGAKKALLAATKGRPKFAMPRLKQILLDPGKPPVAGRRLSQLARLSEATAVHYHLALNLAKRGEYEEALQIFERLSWAPPTAAPIWKVLSAWVITLDRAGQTERAQNMALQLRESNPESERPLNILVKLAARKGDKESVVTWKREIADLKKDQTSQIELAAALTDNDKDAEARNLLDEVLQKDPNTKNAELYLQLGRAWASKDEVKARGYLNEARQLEPSARAYVLLGEVNQKRQKPDDALTNYRKAVEMDPSLVAPRLPLTRLLIEKNKAEEAEEHLRVLLEARRGDAEIAELAGDVYREMDRPRDAVKAYQSVAEETAPPSVLLKIARIQLQQLGQVAPAVRVLKRLESVAPKEAEAQYLLGFAYKDMGRPRDAKSAWERYLELASDGDYAEEVRAELQSMSKRKR